MIMINLKRKSLILGIASAIAMSASSALNAADNSAIAIDIKQQSAGSALLELARKSGSQIMLSQGLEVDINLPAIKGEYTLTAALDEMLTGTGLVYEFTSDDLVVIKQDKENQDAKKDIEEVIVTGSRLIKDPSKMTRQMDIFTREDIENSGITRLDEFLRQLPQNVNAPSNMGSGDFGSSELGLGRNVFGGSAANLRGLGAQYTLILIDGRRPAAGGQFGEITDISNIPLEQVARIEILYDGAAAVYGSDAVGGVINIITNRDYQGTQLNLKVSDTQRGGGQRLDASLGHTFSWDSGSMTATLSYQDQKHIDGSLRDVPFIGGDLAVPASALGNLGSGYNTTKDTPLFYMKDINEDGDTLDDGERISGGFWRDVTVPSGEVKRYYSDRINSRFPGGDVQAYLQQLCALSARGGRYARYASYCATYEPNPHGTLASWTKVTHSELPEYDPNNPFTLYDLTPNELGESLFVPGKGYSLTPADNNKSIALSGFQEINEKITLSLNGKYTLAEKESFTANGLRQDTLYSGNPYNIFRTNIYYSHQDGLPDEQVFTTIENYSFAGTLDYQINDDWNMQLDMSRSVNDQETVSLNRIDSTVMGLFSNGKSGGVALPNSPWDPLFGFTDEKEYSNYFIIDQSNVTNRTAATSAELRFEGVLGSLPAGDIRAQFGVGSRDSKTSVLNTFGDVKQDIFWASNGWHEEYELDYASKTDSIFGEVVVPVTEDLLFNASARQEEYMAVEDKGLHWAGGFNWAVNDLLTVRLNRTYSEIFPAALLSGKGNTIYRNDDARLYNTDRLTQSSSYANQVTLYGGSEDLVAERNYGTSLAFIVDPMEGLNIQLNIFQSNTVDQIGNPSADTLITTDMLDPELIKLNPMLSLIPADHIRTTADNSSELLVNGVWILAPYSKDSPKYSVAEGDMLVDARWFNIGTNSSRGADLTVKYQLSTDMGDWFATWRHNYMDKNEVVVEDLCREGTNCTSRDFPSARYGNYRAAADRALANNNVGTVDQRYGFRSAALPEHRGSVNLVWSYRGLGVNLTTIYQSKTKVLYDESQWEWAEDDTDLRVYQYNDFELVTSPGVILNANLQYDFGDGDLFDAPAWLDGTRISLSVNNLYNTSESMKRNTLNAEFEETEFLNNNYFSPFGIDARGKDFILSLTKNF